MSSQCEQPQGSLLCMLGLDPDKGALPPQNIGVAIQKTIKKADKHPPKNPPKNIPCNFLGCPKIFDNRFNLRRHIMLQHTNIRPFTCDVCGQRIGLYQHLLTHRSGHKGAPELPEPEGGIPSISPYLPVFRVERGKDENCLDRFLKKMELPKFVEEGLLPVPKLIGTSYTF
mmetsp:Transcript_11923/g.13085  ORF Transcript_11923/g.13085 Transcript_11923/m.13085 type:complete len:171 (+) Transcript_11923:149-661(+)|eukprot:CAMPEP_0115010002 /NCGR_PEP_ID=MMETSP0216-20121206/23010_1 /TAXON_ID=223996 /ORGANISM="Protocruzia adherens, Strain Boccale" /LENGTH=170 /DNA_ID=CAMNT_0002378041 /DNA_START=141 /DNA_END=653 /DNA_ORIENTATION=-